MLIQMLLDDYICSLSLDGTMTEIFVLTFWQTQLITITHRYRAPDCIVQLNIITNMKGTREMSVNRVPSRPALKPRVRWMMHVNLAAANSAMTASVRRYDSVSHQRARELACQCTDSLPNPMPATGQRWTFTSATRHNWQAGDKICWSLPPRLASALPGHRTRPWDACSHGDHVLQRHAWRACLWRGGGHALVYC